MRAHAIRCYPRPGSRGRAAWTAAIARATALLGALVLGACGEPRVIDDEVVVALSDATSCRPPAGIRSVRVRALGDAPGATSVELAPDGPRAVPDPGFEVLALAATGEGPGWSGIGYRTVADRGDDLLLLPAGRSCGVADPEARAPLGAAIAVLADGSLVVAGGLDDDGVATRRVITLAPGARRAEMASAELAVASAFASATPVEGGRVLVAGGAIAEVAPAYDSYEEIDPDDPDARVVGALAERRREHAAIALRDGRVLLVGGRDPSGAAMRSIEIVDRGLRRGVASPASLAVARIAPTLALDDRGRVWIAGGETGAEIALERLDPAAGTIERHEIALPRADALAFLPGGRLAWLVGATMHVVLLRDTPTVIEARTGGVAIPDARAIATPGGAVLLVGRDAAALRDPGRGRESARGTSVAPSALAVLGDRSVIELAPTGAAIRREDERTPWEDPPATLLFAVDDAWLLLDPIDRESDPGPAWVEPALEQQGSDLVARIAGARADVRAFRASRMDVGVRGEGGLELVLVPERDPEVAIRIEGGSIVVGDCALAAEGDAISIDPGRIAIGPASCAFEGAAPYGLAVRAREVGARMVSLAIARR